MCWSYCCTLVKNPLRSEIFNFNKFLSNLDVKDFLQDNTNLSPKWVDYGFVDKDHQHIMTEDLLNVGNKLRKLFVKGPIYKETNSISWEKAEFTIIEGLNDCIDTWCSKHGIDKPVLIESKEKVINKLGEKTKTLFNKTSSKFHTSVLHQNNLLNTLNDIYNQFAVTLIDKAIGKVAFICRRFYALVLRKELGLDLNNTGTNKTYIPVHKTNNQVITGHIIFFKR